MCKNYLLSLLCVLCLGTSYSQEKIEHSYWEWVVGSEISDKRLNEIAPHFPRGDDSQYNSSNYDQAILRWQKLYCFEYEALINAPELTRLNPYYTGYENIVEIPYFIRPLSSYDKPIKKETGNDFEDELDYELDLQAWYFVFAPEEFYHIYRIKPTFPEWFDVQAYKDQIVKKIEETKKQEAANK
ncbi:MAG: hypothetical protein H6579_05295 [Chitinophagales bacterium]|nr:hypothetical protein [Bacteroidota bacterium]MCB9256526.1 hypothetical protein [Chitinophagales bacterium]